MADASKDMPKEDFFRVLDGIAKKTDPHKVFVIISGGRGSFLLQAVLPSSGMVSSSA
jgi:hypothetical protein